MDDGKQQFSLRLLFIPVTPATIIHKGFIALATASSGVAASLLPGGRTAHSRFKIPVDVNENFTCNISKQSSLASLI
ncbi:hypothetical protein H5410_058019 [Solanum commersonii]|uniref:ATP-dependent DNA helicase n=1 Tax=Solanum commersonii TaxID=4109 RepID=A0A9J5WRF1_SOLCO|nr:hypothetical protein H5410_058019 [Solanum commersonii]